MNTYRVIHKSDSETLHVFDSPSHTKAVAYLDSWIKNREFATLKVLLSSGVQIPRFEIGCSMASVRARIELKCVGRLSES